MNLLYMSKKNSRRSPPVSDAARFSLFAFSFRLFPCISTVRSRGTAGAVRLSCFAYLPSVPDEPVMGFGPVFSRNALHQLLLHLLDIGAVRQAQPFRNSVDVGIHRDRRNSERV